MEVSYLDLQVKLAEPELEVWNLVLENLAKIESQCDLFYFRPGQYLFYEEHYPYGFFRIKKGSLELESLADAGMGKKIIVAPPRVLLGLAHFVKDMPYQASCRVLKDVEADFFPKSLVRDFVAQSKKISATK